MGLSKNCYNFLLRLKMGSLGVLAFGDFLYNIFAENLYLASLCIHSFV